MTETKAVVRKLLLAATCVFWAGCQVMPKNLLLLSPDYLAAREQQMRKYDTADEKKVLQASAGALQDLGFTIDKSEADLGMIVSSKNRTAVNAGQVTAAITMDLACAMMGCYSNAYGNTDKEQRIEASVLVNSALSKDATLVRVKFQTVIWNAQGKLSRFTTVKDPKIYQEFFDKVSKAIFLEEHKI